AASIFSAPRPRPRERARVFAVDAHDHVMAVRVCIQTRLDDHNADVVLLQEVQLGRTWEHVREMLREIGLKEASFSGTDLLPRLPRQLNPHPQAPLPPPSYFA